ncbi:ATP-dependent DNA helicase [Corynebacterium choanae]|uniref:DNA 5'-3' helicase n=1 Tax=Corynebacterium choanae TaxID=1862358 RepID=A0A3G6J8Q6_9CORY|nr:ATP-dependent DNA helicase [Corynebacterium choanae]AZA14182.1 hypothetical protein CCHOA_08995 [Corynebacterium choanae]
MKESTPGKTSSTDDISGSFDTQQLLAAAVQALGGAPRPGQQQMADAVANACITGKHLAVQAGTGTGKSLGYLVPAVAYAQAADTTVIVSTATIALQRQLVDRDLPRLAKALVPHLGRTPTFATLKGRNNYVCLQRISADPEGDAALVEEADLTYRGKLIAKIAQWAQETEVGDRDSLDISVPDDVWRQVSVTGKECVGASRCAFGEECFAELARKQASDVDVVVTNHAMLAIDALAENQVLPEHDVIIVDEAHELEGRITQVATERLSAAALEASAKRVKQLGAGSIVQRLVDAAEDFGQQVAELPLARMTEFPEDQTQMLSAVQASLQQVHAAISQSPDGERDNDPETFAERGLLSAHIAEQQATCQRILDVHEVDDPAKQRDVVWVEEDSLGARGLVVAPLSVAGLIGSTMMADSTAILTSATLTTGGNFRAVGRSWGLRSSAFTTLDVGTPFTPQKSGILYVAKHLPAPARGDLSPEVLDEMARLIMAAGGRTLGLFSSKRAAVYAKQQLADRLPFDILVQGDDSIGALVERFANDENACLFGTLTLWQGVDVPGPSLSLVLIDRIPFPRPDDPLLQARQQAADAAGRSGFMEVAATHAALLLAQGAGRLLRHVDDKGVVAILDSRLASKRYGSFLLASLPDFWRTTDPSICEQALVRLRRAYQQTG